MQKENGEIEGAKKKSLQMAKKLLEKNLPLEEIIEVTELTKEEIEKLKE